MTKTVTQTVLISGASIAGPALAYWLNRYGFEVTVVERAPEIREGGYKVDIRGAGVTVAERMGVLEEIRKVHTDMQTGTFVNAKGKKIASIDGQAFGGRMGDDVEIMRGDLAQILYRASKADYLFNDSIVALQETADGVDVTFESGDKRTFDLVVGADGLHSNVRALAFGPEQQFIRHLDHYISIFTTSNRFQLDRQELMYFEAGRMVNVYSTRRSNGAKALFAFASPKVDYDYRDLQEQKQLLTKAFDGAGWEAKALLSTLEDAPDFYFDSISQVHMDSWSNGRVVLLGDAAYGASPASGQGTSLALVGAYVLAGELAAAGGDHRVAFAAFEREMRDFVKANQDIGQKFVKEMVPPSNFVIKLRNASVRMLRYMPWKNAVMKAMLAPFQKAANAITLKDY